ncbi:hypothetical protein T4D_13588 [Trichinella pseudospiralis]|uniref:Uncharacterized protein n=1 Tax=Trichinella pseudospiralis TaxID=6337 RepID=A0A0V1FYT6_TRIPS|nr:hypothetical protein T4D_13588 [Trichinella pseudospiralis]
MNKVEIFIFVSHQHQYWLNIDLEYFVYKYYRFVNALPLIHDAVVRIRQQRFVYTLATFAPADCRHDGRKAI